jgi:DNA-binding SARP family transcriptional activator
LLDLGILGPVRAVRAGRDVALGGPKQRAVLALLLIDAGRGGAGGISGRGAVAGVPPPPGAGKTLRSYVSRLRSLLGPEAALVARGGGYVTTLEPGRVDAARFELLVGAARDARASQSARGCGYAGCGGCHLAGVSHRLDAPGP